jgi:hypothetical protein
MRLIDIRAEAATTPFGIERRVFQCLSCRQTAQRLGFARAGLPDRSAPVMKPANAPVIRLQSDRYAARSAPGAAGEELLSRQVAVTMQEPADWESVVGKVSTALKEQVVAARATAWAKTLEKLRSKQMALKERAAPGGTVVGEFDGVWYGQCNGEEAPKPVGSGPERPQECAGLSQ